MRKVLRSKLVTLLFAWSLCKKLSMMVLRLRALKATLPISLLWFILIIVLIVGVVVMKIVRVRWRRLLVVRAKWLA